MGDGRRRWRAGVVGAVVLVVALILLRAACGAGGAGSGDGGDGRSEGTQDSAATDAQGTRKRGGRAEVPGGTAESGSDDAPRRGADRRPGRAARPGDDDVAHGSDDAVAAAAGSRARTVLDVRPPWGRFRLLGDEDPSPGRSFGMDVAIDGDVAVVAASVLKRAGEWKTGLAYVYERRGAEWSLATRIETAAPTGAPWSPRVECSDGRIAVFCPYPMTPEQSILRTYTRDASGAWTLEQEVPTHERFGGDAAMSGDVIAVSGMHEIEIFRRREGTWQADQRIAAAEDTAPWRLKTWIALSGSTLAVVGIDASPDENPPPTSLLRGGAGGFSLETTLDDRESKSSWLRCLALHGNAVLTKSRWGSLEVRERKLTGWNPTLTFARGLELVVPKAFCRPMAADGDLVVLAPGASGAFQILQRREDGWYITTISAPVAPETADRPSRVAWSDAEPNVALSGRTVVVGTLWDADRSGRAWLFDITDDDLARATKLEPDPPK